MRFFSPVLVAAIVFWAAFVGFGEYAVLFSAIALPAQISVAALRFSPDIALLNAIF